MYCLNNPSTPEKPSWNRTGSSSNEGVTMEPIDHGLEFKWECKQCHRMITGDENVAYHLVDKALYGWCAACFMRSG